MLYKRRALANVAGVSADGTGSHRLTVGSDAGPFTDPDGSSGRPGRAESDGAAVPSAGVPRSTTEVVHSLDATGPPLGYSILQAADRARALKLLSDHPLWRSGMDYAIEVFELPDG